MFDLIGNIIPFIIVLMLINGIFEVLTGKKRRREEEPEDEEEGYEVESEPEAEKTREERKPDLAAEFERRLKKRQEAEPEKEERVYKDKPLEEKKQQRVHTEKEAAHDTKGRLHGENEGFAHDKSKVYRDPRGDYSYNEEEFNKQVAAFSAQYGKAEEQPRPRVRLKHAGLVHGVIMAEVLQKPRALQPYDSEQNF